METSGFPLYPKDLQLLCMSMLMMANESKHFFLPPKGNKVPEERFYWGRHNTISTPKMTSKQSSFYRADYSSRYVQKQKPYIAHQIQNENLGTSVYVWQIEDLGQFPPSNIPPKVQQRINPNGKNCKKGDDGR